MDPDDGRKLVAISEISEQEGSHDEGKVSKAEKQPVALESSLFFERPEPMDVICGRGKSGPHPGNQRFRKYITEHKSAYQQSKRREEKSRITQSIVEELTTKPPISRFLLKDAKTQMWFDAGLEYGREKVSHALRSRPVDDTRKKAKPKRKGPRKIFHTPEIEETANRLIVEQQKLLKSMIDRKVFPVWMQEVKESLATG